MVASSYSRSGGQQFVSGDTTPGWGTIDWPRGLTILTQITAIPMCMHMCMCACVGNERGGEGERGRGGEGERGRGGEGERGRGGEGEGERGRGGKGERGREGGG